MFRIIATRGTNEIIADAPLDRLPELLKEPGTFVWVDLSGPAGDTELSITRDVFNFHQLAIEDCFESRPHPKIDEYEDYLYLITHGLRAGSTAESVEVVELDAFVGRDFIVTHHGPPSRSVTAVTEIVLKTGLPLRRGAMGVLHALLDRQVEGLEDQLDAVEERITELEDAVFARPSNKHIASLLAVKRNILQLRRWMAKQREVMMRLGRREFALVSANDGMLFRDVHDHLVRITDLLENFREMLTSIQEAYLSVTSNRLNEIMKFLTLFTALMMPLTVITGIYGMNFEHMPELRARWGYPAALFLMAVVSGSVLLFFRYRGWLGRPTPLDPVLLDDTPPIDQTSADQPSGDSDKLRARTTRRSGSRPTVGSTPSRDRS